MFAHTLLVLIALILNGCASAPSGSTLSTRLPESEQVATLETEGEEVWNDRLAGPFFGACPAPVSNSAGALGADYEEVTEAVKLRFQTAMYAADPLTQHNVALDQADMNRLYQEAKEQKAWVRQSYWPVCDENRNTFETIAVFEKIGDGPGFAKIEIHFRSSGYPEAPSLRWSSTVWYRPDTT